MGVGGVALMRGGWWVAEVRLNSLGRTSIPQVLFHACFMEVKYTSSKSLKRWWARQGLNLRPHPCEGCALPLSYAPALARNGAEGGA